MQAEALRLVIHLVDRIPNLVPLLLNAPTTAPVPLAARLQEGCATALQDSLFIVGPATAPAGAAPHGDTSFERGDPRPSLTLQLLFAALEQPAPNLAHLLCGYELESASTVPSLPDLRRIFTILGVVIEAVGSVVLARVKPVLYEQCMELIFHLAAAPGESGGGHNLSLPKTDAAVCMHAAPQAVGVAHCPAWLTVAI